MVESHHLRARTSPLDAVVVVPGSKSIANRALICATLATGTSTLRNVPAGDDTLAMLECVGRLGAGIGTSTSSDGSGSDCTVIGVAGVLAPGPITLHAKLAGTTSRFVTALCLLGRGEYQIDGFPPLRARPMGPLHDALRQLGSHVVAAETWGHLPVSVSGTERTATIQQSVVRLPGDISSQYITALMLIGPYLARGLRMELTTPLISRPYVSITKAVMASFGVTDVVVGDRSIEVAPGAYGAQNYMIEPDASSASYALAAAAVCGGTVRVPGLGPLALQGDAAFADVLATMGCVVTRDESGTRVTSQGALVGTQINMADLSDLVPTLAIVAPFATTPTQISGVAFIRNKESDRLGDLARELQRCGVRVTELADGLRIEPSTVVGATLDTHHDHRLAMAFAILGLRVEGIVVNDPQVVSKSWPDFWAMLATLTGPL